MKQVLLIFSILFLLPSFSEAGVVRRSTGTVKLNSSAINHQTSGLIGLWTFDGPDTTSSTAIDRSGSNFNGTLNSFTSFTSSLLPGKRGAALRFDGVDDNVSLGDVAEPGTITLSAWVKPAAVQTGMKIVSKKMAGLGAQYGLGTSDSDPSKFKAVFFSSAPSSDVCESTGTNGTYVANKWYHVVATYDADTCKIYVNGVDVTSVTSDNAAGTILNSTSALRIGADGGSSIAAGTYFSGLIDDVRIYNYPFTFEEVQKLYQSTGGAATANVPRNDRVTNGLVGLWSFDGPDMFANVRDGSRNGYNGFMQNFAATSTVTKPGVIGQAVKFDGADDGINVSNIASSVASGNMSVSLWVKPNRTVFHVSGTDGMFFALADVPSANDFKLGVTSTEKLGLIIGASQLLSTNAVSWSANHWYHVVGTYSTTAGAKIYLDNVLVGSDPSLTTRGGTASLLAYIGIQSDGQFPTAATFDDVRVYAKTLSTAEISQLYNLGR